MSTTDAGPAAPTLLAQKGVAVSGAAVEITGAGATAGDSITLYDGAAIVGTGTLDANGDFDITTTTTFTDGVYDLTATETDANGVASPSASVTVSVEPPAPVIGYANGAPTNGHTLFLLGTGQTGDTITFYADGNSTSVGSGVVGADGVFAIATTATFAEGDHVLTATQTDPAGVTSAASAPLTVVVDPAPITLGEPKPYAVNGGAITVTGRGEAGETVTLYADGSATPVATAVVTAAGTFTATTSNTFADGEHSFTGTETNAQGLTSPLSATKMLPVLPSTPTFAGAAGPLTVGMPVVVTGTGEPGDTINIYIAGATKKVSLGSGVVAADGTYSVDLTAALPEGRHSLDARQTDPAGVSSALSAAMFVSLLPAAPTIGAVVGQPVGGGKIEVTGTAVAGAAVTLYANGSSTVVGQGVADGAGHFDITTTATFADGVIALVARQKPTGEALSGPGAVFDVDVAPKSPKLLAQVGQAVGGDTITVRGTGVAGETITIYADGGAQALGSATVGASKTFTVTTQSPFADGGHTLTAVQTDSHGFASAASAPLTVKVRPSSPTVTGAVAPAVKGQPFQIQGTGTAGEVIALYVNSDPNSLGAATVAADGTWVVDVAPFTVNGNRQFTATQTDSQGLTSKPGAATIVPIEPAAPVLTGEVGSPSTTADLVFSGTGQFGDTITLYSSADGSAVGSAQVGRSGTFQITTTHTYAAGSYTFSATQTDAASLTSPMSANLAVTVPASASAALLSQHAATLGAAGMAAASLASGGLASGSGQPSPVIAAGH